jgi:SH3-like domain-containing protein
MKKTMQSWVTSIATKGALIGLGVLIASGANAADFKSVSVNAAILYDAPTAKAKRLYVAPKGMPVQVITVVEPFVKVRDMSGDVAWLDRRSIGAARTVVSTTTCTVRSTAADSGAAVLQVERGVVLDVTEVGANGWVKVKHADGVSGFVKASDVWGL